MANVHGIEFVARQSELVRDLVRTLLKDGGCGAYGVPNIKPGGELRMATHPPVPGAQREAGVFLRIRPGVNEAIVLRPAHAHAGEPISRLTKFSEENLLEIIRIWRQEVASTPGDERPAPAPAVPVAENREKAAS